MGRFHGGMALGRASLGAFAGGGRVVFGPFSFSESWSSDDFASAMQFNSWVKPYLDQVNRKDLTWDPPSQTVLSRASGAWTQWQGAADAGSGSAAGFLADIAGQMKDLTARADALSLTGSLGNRSEVDEVSRYDVFNEIKALALKVANSAPQAALALAAAQASGVPTIPAAGTINTGPSMFAPSGTKSFGPASSSGAAIASGGDNTMLYVGLGAGALLLVGVLYMRRRKSSVAGYRRRRR